MDPNELWSSVLNYTWYVALGAWVLAMAEWLAVVLLVRWPFAFGVPIARQEFSVGLPPEALMAPGKGETSNTKYVVTDDQKCLFRRKYPFFDRKMQTVLEIKGTIAWEAGVLRSHGRASVGALSFLLIWLTGWTIGGVAIGADSGNWTPMIIGWIAILGMVGVSWLIERHRFKKFHAEVQSALGIEAPRGPL